MRSVHFFLFSFLVWQAGWVSHHAVAAQPSDVIMSLNSTLSLADFRPWTSVMDPSTARAFYFSYDTSMMVEVSIDPSRASIAVVAGPMAVPSGPSRFIYQALLVPAPPSNLSAPSTVYLTTSNSILLYHVIPPSTPDNSSTLLFIRSVSLPTSHSMLPSSPVLTDANYLYLSGPALSPTVAFVMRLPHNNFTTDAWDIEYLPQGVVLTAAATDGSYLYVASSPNTVYRLSISQFVLDPTPLVLTSNTASGFGGAFADPLRNFVYFLFSDELNDNPNTLVRVDTTSFSQVQEILTFPLPTLTRARVIVQDVHGGHVFFGHNLNPGMITDVNLATFSIQSFLPLTTPQAYLKTALIDVTNSWAYFTTYTDYSILKIQIPLPCAGLDAGNSISANNCSYPNGYCEYATCHCYPELDYEGPVCASKKCPNDCYRDASTAPGGESHGTCLNGTCNCNALYTGDDCSSRRCPFDCLGRGQCTGAPLYQCRCDRNWFGADCSEFSLIPPCDELGSCSSCATNSSCGWCHSSRKCMEGDSFGPMAQLCERYSFQTCPNMFYFVFGYILTIICWLFLIASAIITVIQDFTLPDNTKTKRFVLTFWWRNQLAAKTWQLVEYMQMLAITGYLAVDMPALYSEFILPFQWSVLHLPYPFEDHEVIRPPANSRDLLTTFDQGRVVHSEAHELFLGNLFFYALVIVAPFVLFVIPVMLVACCMSDFSQKEKMIHTSKSRAVYCMVRLHQFVYFPLLVTSLFTLAWYPNAPEHPGSFKAAVVFSVFVLIGLGLVYPVVTFLRIRNKDKELFTVDFSQKYGSLYQKYHFRKGFFNTIQIGKLLLIALWVAALYNRPVPQMILIALTHAAYFFVLLFLKPNADHIHYFTDLVATALEVVVFLLLLGLRNHTTAQRWALGVVVVHILAIVVILAGLCSTIFKMNGIIGFSDLRHAVANRNSTQESLAGLQNEHRVSSSSSISSSM